MQIEKRPFDVDVLGPDLGFIHGTLQLIHDSVLSGEFETLRGESLSWVLIEAEERCTRVMGMFEEGTGMELQTFWNDAHPDEADSKEAYCYEMVQGDQKDRRAGSLQCGKQDPSL